ncbi:MAG: hypothetical protein N2A99_02265 [Carnobacterium alterfunditum]
MSKKEDDFRKIEDELKKLKKRKSDILKTEKYKSSQQYRKDRANRLIQTGALSEKYFKLENLDIEEREELFKMFADFINANKPKKFK